MAVILDDGQGYARRRGLVQLQDLRVLIVDEHGPSIAVLFHALTSRGFTCERACSAELALARVASFQPDVVIYEWNLSAGGRGLPQRLRAASTRALAVIALSTLDEPAGFREMEQVDAYLMKPLDVAQLDSLMRGLRPVRAAP
jgi:CheY-like chemotaxis protein